MAITRSDFPLPDLSDPDTAPFFAAAAEGVLRIPRCDACTRFVWYPESPCPHCGAATFTWTATSGTGTLFSWAVVRRAFLPAFAEMVPFVTALVALDDDPRVRVLGYVVDVDPDADELVAGAPLHAVFRPLRFPTVPGREVIVPMWARA
jgi:uncharacterized OB-fold protein